MQSVGIVDKNGDLDLECLTREAKGKGTVTRRDARDQDFLNAFLDADIAHEPKFPKRTPQTLQTLETQDDNADADRGPPSLRTLAPQLMVRTLQAHQYIVSTTSNAAAKLLRQEITTKIIDVDEVSQDSEPGTLLPVMHNLNSL